MEIKKPDGELLKPSDFYRIRRPEYFSDSQVIYDILLTKEQLSFEISNISKNQKQDEFEMLCRRLSEKLICPNLIPQVGPTGGGDGKTDTESHPVSSFITDRWYVPENGWEKNEKWAFAISSKKDWRSKLKKDIDSILSTKRGYTKIFFITNQCPSSRIKKNMQDNYKKDSNLEVIILDGEWIVEKILTNNFIDIVVDSLNLSSVYKQKKEIKGCNDEEKIIELNDLEHRIERTNRYFDVDYQLTEDALRIAVLSRMLEKPRDEVEGKFQRAQRFCEKLGNTKQLLRLHYQKAWTYINYYDDGDLFYKEYKLVKSYINDQSSNHEIELYTNLFNLLTGIYHSKSIIISDDLYDYKRELIEILGTLDARSKRIDRPCSALIARTQKAVIELTLNTDKDILNKNFKEIKDCFVASVNYIEYPFESFSEIIMEISQAFPLNNYLDNLIDTIAELREKHYSTTNAGKTYLVRGVQKLKASNYYDSIRYFGKAVMKLAKEDTQKALFNALIGLDMAYEEVGLIWTSYTCLIAATSIAFRYWFEEGKITTHMLNCVRNLLIKELKIGRVPNFLLWHELYLILRPQVDYDEEAEIPTENLSDACLSVRLINTPFIEDVFTKLPSIFASQNLPMSEDTVSYLLGQISDDMKKGIESICEINEFYKKIAEQPFRDQMIFNTSFCNDNVLIIESYIIGCKVRLQFESKKDLVLISETVLSFIESFYSTAIQNLFPYTEEILIDLKESNEVEVLELNETSFSNRYELFVNVNNFIKNASNDLWYKMIELIAKITSHHFYSDNLSDFLENIFKKEEISEKISLILNRT